jgi:integrase
MSLFKRNGSKNWYYKIYPPGGGKEIYGSTGTTDRKKAKEFHDRLKTELWDQAKLGHKPRYTWNEAVVRFMDEKAHLASIDTIRFHMRWLHPYLDGVVLADIDRKMIDRIIAARRDDYATVCSRKTNRKVSPGTVNRVISIMISVLNAAHAWEWIDRVPKVTKLKEPTKRIRWLTQEQAQQLIAELPRHLADMATFSLETGLRRSNVTHLKWSQVDMERKMAWIHPDEAKARKAIPVPLSDAAIQVIEHQRSKRRDADCVDYVFVFQGRPVIQTATNTWRRALAKIGITNFRWHDLRHTWASWHIQRGTPLHVLQALGRWETIEMVQRYAHLSADHLSQWAQSFATKRGNLGAI